MASSGRKEKDPYGPLTSETRIKILSKIKLRSRAGY